MFGTDFSSEMGPESSRGRWDVLSSICAIGGAAIGAAWVAVAAFPLG